MYNSAVALRNTDSKENIIRFLSQVHTDFTDALVDINQVLRDTRVIIDFFITADVTVLQHYVKTYRAGVIFSFCQ